MHGHLNVKIVQEVYSFPLLMLVFQIEAIFSSIQQVTTKWPLRHQHASAVLSFTLQHCRFRVEVLSQTVSQITPWCHACYDLWHAINDPNITFSVRIFSPCSAYPDSAMPVGKRISWLVCTVESEGLTEGIWRVEG